MDKQFEIGFKVIITIATEDSALDWALHIQDKILDYVEPSEEVMIGTIEYLGEVE